MGLRYIVDQSFQLLVCGHKVKSYLVTVRNVAMLNIASNIVDVSYFKTNLAAHLTMLEKISAVVRREPANSDDSESIGFENADNHSEDTDTIYSGDSDADG